MRRIDRIAGAGQAPMPPHAPMAADEEPTLAALALGVAQSMRDARRMLDETIVPVLPPARRAFAQDIARRLSRMAMPTERLVQDLDALLAMLDREVQARTHHGWEADEHHVRGGWPTIHRDADGEALACGADALRRLHRAITA